MNDAWFSAQNEAEVPSPALLLVRERIEHNLRQMLAIAGGPERLRPHVKTHKLGPLVARQVELGITRFKCATIAEAEMTAASGASDVLLAVPPVGPACDRLVALAEKFSATRFSTIVDEGSALHHLGAVAAGAGVHMGVWLDVDCGMRRTGVRPGPLAVDVYRQVSQTAGVEVRGLHVYDGHIVEPDRETRQRLCDDAFAPVLELRAELEARGLDVPAMVAGGSPTFPFHAAHADRECSPGTTVLWDFGYADAFPDLEFLPAAVLLARVISKPEAGRLCVDLGHKAVASERPHPRVRFIEIPDASFVTHSEEHLVIETPRAPEFPVGSTLHGIPLHVCPTVALHGEACVVENGVVSERWRILARNRQLTI
jgi:D-serine deaminase-like pyridoxal phosphate-dependent protein